MENKEVKPIVVIYFPEDFVWDGVDGRIIDTLKLMKELNRWGMEDVDENYAGYVWWCFIKPEITAPEFQVFYPKDFTETDYKSLETLIQSAIQEIKQ